MEINNVKTLLYSTTLNNGVTQSDNAVTKIINDVSLLGSNSATDEVILSGNTVTPHSNVTTVEPTVYEVTTETPMTNIQNIKEVLYKINHPAEGFVSGGKTQSNEIGDAWDILQHINRASDSTVNVNTGVSKAQLLKLTHRDDWEASNNNLFGNINLVFDKLDTNGDDILSYSELKNFTGYELGSTNRNFQGKVDNYATQIQNEYMALGSLNAKLDFAIEKAVEYLEAMGMTEQLEALERLQNENKIGFKDCNPGKTLAPGVGWTLGAYAHLSSGGMYITDDRTNKFDLTGDGVADWYTDGGLFLDKTWYSQSSIQWYELTSTLIHELTHATAYLYSDYPNAESASLISYVGLSDDAISMLRDAGCITASEYNTYSVKHNNGTLTETEYKKLAELTEIMWGEYVAYQTNEDYLDSVAHGDFGVGANEDENIDAHITANYTSEPKPTGDWWKTYGKIGYNA